MDSSLLARSSCSFSFCFSSSDFLRWTIFQTESIMRVNWRMSADFIKGVKENLPNAQITFDKFHIVKALNEAVDKVRRQEQKDRPDLKNTRYIFLKNPENLTIKQSDMLEGLKLKDLNLKTMRAYQLRLNFQEIWLLPPRSGRAVFEKMVLLGNTQPNRTDEKSSIYLSKSIGMPF